MNNAFSSGLSVQRWAACWLVALLLVVLAGCGGGGSDTPARIIVPPQPGLVSLPAIEVTPALPTLASGTSLDLVATGVLSDGTTRDYSDKVTWSSSDKSVAPDPVAGHVITLAKGSVTLKAELYGKFGIATLTVTDAALSRLEIIPQNPKLAKGTALNLVALGHYSDGSTQDLTSQVAWATTDASVAPVSNADGSKGLLSAPALGSVTVNATFGTRSADVGVTVTDAALTALAIEPAKVSLLPGAGVDLSATGFYSDGSTQDLTRQVVWVSSTPAAVVVGDTSSTAGRAVALAPTNAAVAVVATLGGVSARALLTVRAPTLQNIEVTPASVTLASGFTQALTALGHFNDGTTQDITAQVVWRSSAPAALVVSNASGSEGLVTALSVGNADISALLVDAVGSVLFEGSAHVTVTPETLTSIEIEPAAPRIAKGTRLALQAIGHYSDGSIQDLTARVSWSIAGAAAVASIDTSGVVLASDTAGSMDVTALLAGKSSTANLTVTDAQLQVINISPRDIQLAINSQMQLKAMGGFSDGSWQDLSGQVVWESSIAAIAAVGQTGLLSALSEGDCRVMASFEQAGGGEWRADSVVANVVDASLTAIDITPATQMLAAGTEIALQATATYNDGSSDFQQDVTDRVQWHSADEAIARVDNGAGRAGRVQAVTAGSTTISASLDGLTSAAPLALSVSSATLASLSIDAASTTLYGGTRQSLRAVGTFSDGSQQDLTDQVVWSSSDVGLAQVSNGFAERGWVTAATGVSDSVTVTASRAGVSAASLVLNVIDSPQRPVSLTLQATPDVIENDDLDMSVLTAQLLAADPASTVADGTQVTFTVSDGATVLQTTTVPTSGGSASVNFSTTTLGQLDVQAAVLRADGSEVRQSITLLSTDQQKEAISGIAYTDALLSSGNILADGQFGAFIFNTSNRDFTLQRFVFCNGATVADVCDAADVLYADDSPNQAVGNLLKGGSKFGSVYTLPDDVPYRGVSAIFYLEEPAASRPFYFRIDY